MSASHTLGAVAIPRGMIWIDEFAWVAVHRATDYSVTGALVVQEFVRQAGRPITLEGAEDAGWISRATLLTLQTMAAQTGQVYTLTLADGRSFDVRFAGGDASPIEARPISRPELPAGTHPYIATLRLVEV